MFIDSADNALKYKNSAGSLVTPTGGSGAPTTVDYLVKTADAGLSAERVVTDTATIVTDWATAGQAKFNIPNDAITFAIFQNIVSQRLLGRSTVGTGDMQELSLGGSLSLIAGVLDVLLANGTVTLAQLANLTAPAIVGRVTAGAGVPEALTPAQIRTMLGLPTIVYKTSDESRINTTTYADDAAITFPVAANTKYKFKVWILFTTGATGDFKCQITGPASPTYVSLTHAVIVVGGAGYGGVGMDAAFSQSRAIQGAAGDGWCLWEGILHNGANAGSVTLQWAQNALDNAVNTLVRAGSHAEYAVVV